MKRYWVYVLFSAEFSQTYVWQTEDVGQRLGRHNAGRVLSTRRYRPWTLVHTEEHVTRAEAMRREKWLKSGVGREFVAALVRAKNLE